MGERNIALIGFRATGKSTVGKILAGKLKMAFVDMDERLTEEAGHDIATWVEQKGWDSFRSAESDLLLRLGEQQGTVVATGGGIVLDPENRRLLRERFLTVWLKAAPETIHARVCSDPRTPGTRPALCELPLEEEIKKVLSEREPLYSQVAEMEIDTEGRSAQETALEIVRGMK